MLSDTSFKKSSERNFQPKKSTNFKRYSPGKIVTANETTQELADYSEKFNMFMSLAEEIQKKKVIEKNNVKNIENLENLENMKNSLENEKIEKNEENSKIDEANVKPMAQNEEIIVENTENQIIILENGNTYSGQVYNGKPHGQGTEFREDGLSYKGDFRNGKWHGVGYIVNSNLDICFAEFIDGEPVGF